MEDESKTNTFTIIPDAIMTSQEINTNQKLILAYLLRQAVYNQSNRFQLSSQRIIEHTGLESKESVCRYTSVLVSKGFIKKELDKNDKGVITKYILDIPKIEETFGFDFKKIFCNNVQKQ